MPPSFVALATGEGAGSPTLHSNFTRPAYLEAVGRAKQYIAAGDIYQVNLSQRPYCLRTGRP